MGIYQAAPTKVVTSATVRDRYGVASEKDKTTVHRNRSYRGSETLVVVPVVVLAVEALPISFRTLPTTRIAV